MASYMTHCQSSPISTMNTDSKAFPKMSKLERTDLTKLGVALTAARTSDSLSTRVVPIHSSMVGLYSYSVMV